MNLPKRKLTAQQERIAYRRAVESSLVAFFEKSPKAAANLVGAWWERMQGSSPYTTGVFMHDEPLNTAADLAGCSRAPAIRQVADRYSRIIEASMPKPRKSVGKKQSHNESRTARAA